MAEQPYVKSHLNPGTGKIEYRSIGTPVKAADTGDTVSGYLVRFTDANNPDLHGEYFDKRTYFWEKERPIKGAPILIDHAFDSTFKGLPVGIVSFAEEREVGIWMEGKLHEREDYLEYLESMRAKSIIDADDATLSAIAGNIDKAVKSFFGSGQAQWSSGAHPQSVEADEDGHIKSWAIIEATGCFNPAESNGTEIQLKSAFEQLDVIFTQIQTAQAAKDVTGHKEPHADVEQPQDNLSTTPIQKMENPIMDEQMLRDLIRVILEEMNADGEKMDEEEIAESVEKDMEEETAKMDDDEKMDEEETAEKMAGLIIQHITRKQEQQARVLNSARKAARKAALNAPVSDDAWLPAAKSNGNGATPRISGVEHRKFAGLSGADMALGVKFLQAGLPPVMQKRAKIGDLVSEAYANVMAQKMAAEVQERSFTDPVAALNFSSALPFKSMKADELNASDIAGQGTEWVGVYYDEQLWERVRDETELFNLMSSKGMRIKDIPAGSPSVTFQTDTSSGSVFLRNQANDLSSNSPEITARISNFGTGNITATAKEHVLAQFVTDILEEDSIIPTLRYANQDMIQTLAEALEDAMTNGDTTTTNNINNDGASTTAAPQQELYLAWDGIRHHFLVDQTTYGADHSTAALAASTILNTRNLLPGRIRVRRQNLLYVMDYGTDAKARQLAELFTRDKADGDATLYTGILPDVDGVQVYTSGLLRSADTDGKVTGAGNGTDTGTLICVYAPYWAYGRKRAVSIETARGTTGALAGGTTLVATVRHAFVARGAGAAAGTYNIQI